MLARAKPILIVAAALVLLLSGCVSDSEVQELW
jgi:outer membrane murein-binding lipoprotein Lpp